MQWMHYFRQMCIFIWVAVLDLFWFNMTNLLPNCHTQCNKSVLWLFLLFTHWRAGFMFYVWWHFHAIYSQLLPQLGRNDLQIVTFSCFFLNLWINKFDVDFFFSCKSRNFQSGMVRTKRGDYYIEPSKLHRVNDAGHHPHIIFQRSAIKVSDLNFFK